jgi:hypothetical protein
MFNVGQNDRFGSIEAKHLPAERQRLCQAGLRLGMIFNEAFQAN